MAKIHVFADESGNFDFSRTPGASRYFILTTVTMEDCSIGASMMGLRREMALAGDGLTNPEFHATTDEQAVRNRVFDVLGAHKFRVDATILDKAKAQPSIRPTSTRFYQMAWYLHMKFVVPRIVSAGDDLLVVSASIGKKAEKAAFHAAVTDVIGQAGRGISALQGGDEDLLLGPVNAARLTSQT